MVVWLFAGGGEAEARGLIPFLEKHFVLCTFQRKTPIRRKPGPKPNKIEAGHGYGRTGRSLAHELQRQLKAALVRQESCDLILVIDDLDCHDAQHQEQRFLQAINSILSITNIERCIGFAAPELEAWLVADWNNTIARDVDFRSNHEAMRWWLSQEKRVPFDAPETFSVYDQSKDSCQEKLSNEIINAAMQQGRNYSKAIHTPRLLEKIDPQIVQAKCPLFQRWYTCLSNFCNQEVTR